jgi:hypothetical protein
MFRKTDPQQELFGAGSQLSDSARERLKGSWAEVFRSEVLSVLMECEEAFAPLYGETGRPNFSVGRHLGICVLQEMNSLSDQAALDAFSFDVRWQHALDVAAEEAYLSRRSHVDFRRRVVEHDPEMELMRGVFDRVSKGAIRRLGLSTSEQRLDSTVVMSNIRVGGLLELFRSTAKHFLKGLDDEELSRVPKDILAWHEEESDGWFGLGPAERRDKLDELIVRVKRLIDVFAKDEGVAASERYQLLLRVFDEHCEVVVHKTRNSSRGGKSSKGSKGKGSKGKRSKGKGSKGKGKGRTRSVWNETEEIILRHKKGGTVQSPFDPDAEYGHKGVGYAAHVTETCNNQEKPEIITDYEVHANARSDIGKAKDVVDRLEETGLKPETLYADAGYPTSETSEELKDRGTNLFAPVHRGKMKREVMGRDQFDFDESGRVTRCPRGHEPIDHRVQSPNGEGQHLHAYFDGDTCRACPDLERCPVRAPNHRTKGCSPTESRGDFRLDIHPALRGRDERLAEQTTKEWKNQYRIRAGVEATMSELKRTHGLAKLRVRRRPRVTFAVSCKLTACNVKRWAKAVLSAEEGEAGAVGTLSTLIVAFLLLWWPRSAETALPLTAGVARGEHTIATAASQAKPTIAAALAAAA